MNNQDFQNICNTLLVKYDAGKLIDDDVDSFADVVTNVLGRDDLRAPGTEYESLESRISHDYENDINMHPLLARMYELCRMYALYRPRPLTEMERKKEQQEIESLLTKKYPVCISVLKVNKTIANCWWEDLGGMDEIADKVRVIADSLVQEENDHNENRIEETLFKAFTEAGGRLDSLDADVIEKMVEVFGEDDIITSFDPTCGIIALNESGVERNRVRQGVNVKMSLDERMVNMDAFITYGKSFYKSLVGTEDDIEVVGQVDESMISFSFDKASDVADKWKSLGDVFAIPGSDGLIGAKRPVAIK